MMTVEIRPLKTRDFNQARRFAITGMHLGRYTSNAVELYLYSKYFWNSEISQATQAYGAYVDGAFAGTLLARMDSERPILKSLWRSSLSKLMDWIIQHFYGGMTTAYDRANTKMLACYQRKESLDGEILFFAVNPEIVGQGVGTLLLEKLAKVERGKRVYLYTDSGCTYQFYQRKGFEKVGQTEVALNEEGQQVPLTCLLFSKIL